MAALGSSHGYLAGSVALALLLLVPELKPQDRAKTERASAIEIRVQTSRPQPTAGTGLGVFADMKNVSESPVYLHEQHITLVLPPELEGPSSWSYGHWAHFPTEPASSSANDLIALKPGDTYRVFWTSKPENESSKSDSQGQSNLPRPSFFPDVFADVYKQVRTEMSFLFFSPGPYEITVTAKYWGKTPVPGPDYRTVVQSSTLQVAAPQSVILLGAALGGVIAYFIFPQARRRLIKSAGHDERQALLILKRLPKEGAGLLGAVFLSAIVTILLSRISETQFLIRVTVSDFWGAIAIGFLANYGGARLLDRLLPKPGDDQQQTQGTESRVPKTKTAGLTKPPNGAEKGEGEADAESPRETTD